jgi:hypothetical protein
MRTRIGGLVLAVVAVLAGLGCGSDEPAESATTEPVSTAPVSSVGGSDDELPGREPDATGVVGTARSLAGSSDAYYEGMGLARHDGDPLVVGPDGDVLSVSDLRDGDEIAVWIDGACAESYPVQCDVVAIRITRPAP